MQTVKKPSLNKGCQIVFNALKTRSLSSAQELYFDLKAKDADAPGLTTIYRALESLVKLELVQAVDMGDGEKRYEAVEAGEHHHHLVCEVCRKSVHLDECIVESLEAKVLSQHGFRIKSHILELFGVCSKCAKTSKVKI